MTRFVRRGGGPGSRWRRAVLRKHPQGARVRSEVVVRGRESEFVVRVERAPGLELFRGTPRRWWNSLAREKSWWLTVYRSEVSWPVLREKFDSAEEADFRARGLAERLKSGEEELGMAAARRRVKR